MGTALLCAGCSQAWFNTFLDPSQPANFRTNEIVEIKNSISLHDKPLGIPGATEPKPEDLVAIVEEYRIGPGDTLSVKLLDFVQPGYETDLTPLQVNELGYVDIIQLPEIQAEGLTARELKTEIIQRAIDAGIYSAEGQPTVTVQVMSLQQRTYNVTGAVVNPGLFQIIRPDFRLMEAVNAAGGLDNSVKNIYVFRDQPREKVIRESTGRPPRANAPPVAPIDSSTPAPPVSPMTLSVVSGGAGQAQPADKQTGSQPATRLAVPREQAEQELRDAIEPGTATAPASAPSQTPATQPSTTTSGPRWIYMNDQFIEKPGTEQPVEPVSAPPETLTPAQPTTTGPAPTTEPVNWEALAQEGQQRIIRIPADKLRNGDPSYNIVIRHNDLVRLDPGPVGKFYLSGNVSRPGTYDFMGEDLTIRQAIAAAGGLGPLAWPTRCSITRRIDEGREEMLQLDLARIMEGADPDFYLKPNDIVDVGTHAVAPLLLTIRNSFRLTYGFGFVYDRNFADIDAYIPQQNPRDVRRATLQSRFPGLLP